MKCALCKIEWGAYQRTSLDIGDGTLVCMDCARAACEEKLARVEEEKLTKALANANSNSDRSPCVIVNHPPIRDPYGVREPTREATGRMLTVENKPVQFGCHRDYDDLHVVYFKCVDGCKLPGSEKHCRFWRKIQ